MISPVQYWRIKAAVSAVELQQERARQLVAPAHALLAEALRQAGLDPQQNYQLDDVTETITAHHEPGATDD